MTSAASAPARSPWPSATMATSASALGLACLLWGTTPGTVTVPMTPPELGLALSALGAFVLRRRPGSRVGGLIAATGVAFSVVALAAATLNHFASGGGSPAVAQVALAIGWLASALPVPWLLLVLWFPDGRFTGTGWRGTFIALAAAALAVACVGYLFGPAGHLPSMLSGVSIAPGLGGPFAGPGRHALSSAAGALSVLPVVGLPALVARWRRETALVRQQIRWLLAASVLTVIVTVVAVGLGHGPGGLPVVGRVVNALAQPLPAVAITVAVLRYRLWEIDVFISRAVVYGALWAVLSLLLLVPAVVSGYLVGGPGAVAAVVAALFVTLAFQPVRRWLQEVVDDRVYGARRRGRLRLARAGDTLRAAGDVDSVAPRLAEILREALALDWATVLLHVRSVRGASLMRPVGSVGIGPPTARVSPALAAELVADPEPRVGMAVPTELLHLLPKAPAVVVPLVAADELIGAIACGDRHGESLDRGDIDALDRFACECALGLRALRLDAELRQRLDEIERQASELRSSRQRLVRAQDEERRRMERDLHDGVQQQLVSLATTSRRLAISTSGELRADLDRLAQEAEDAVFALQDLARGIFPVVLVDHGLAVALRAHAGRGVLPVRVDIEPGLSHARFEHEIEAALYFVALEALTNVAKHAPAASASISLRRSDAGGELVLEVHDDGPGLTSADQAGAGLVNMRDRVSAVGGTFGIESRPGSGTWIRAVAPLGSDVLPLTRSTPVGRSTPPSPAG